MVPAPARVGCERPDSGDLAQAWLSRDRFRDGAEFRRSRNRWDASFGRECRSAAIVWRARAREHLGLPLDLARRDGYAAIEERLSPSTARVVALDPAEHEREALKLRVIDKLPYNERIGATHASPRSGSAARLARPAAPCARNYEGGPL